MNERRSYGLTPQRNKRPALPRWVGGGLLLVGVLVLVAAVVHSCGKSDSDEGNMRYERLNPVP